MTVKQVYNFTKWWCTLMTPVGYMALQLMPLTDNLAFYAVSLSVIYKARKSGRQFYFRIGPFDA